MRIIWLWLFVALLVLAGCGKTVPPQEVAKKYYQLLEIARQSGFEVVQEELVSMLSKDSREAFQACAKRLNDRLHREESDVNRFEASDCFVFSNFTGKRHELTSKIQAEGPEHVLLELTSGGSTRVLDLMKEEGAWRIDLSSTIERNQQVGTP